jgi:hypothetical protein
MRKTAILFALVLSLAFGIANVSAQDYIFGFSDWTSTNNLTLNGTPYYNTDSGWFDGTGYHEAYNRNYIVGYGSNYRNYFSFDIPEIEDITSAVFNVYSYGITAPQTYYLYGTSLSPRQVDSSYDYHSMDLYNALGAGPLIGMINVTGADAYATLSISLNSTGLAWLNEHDGQSIVLGGTSALSQQVPEPFSILLLGFGLAGLAGARRFTR